MDMKDSAVFQASLAIHTGIVVPFKDRFPQRIVAVLRSMLIVLALRDRFPCLQRRKELCIVCRGLDKDIRDRHDRQITGDNIQVPLHLVVQRRSNPTGLFA